jgi:hypothetical protein
VMVLGQKIVFLFCPIHSIDIELFCYSGLGFLFLFKLLPWKIIVLFYNM